MTKDDYYAYSSTEIIRQDIAFRIIQTINEASETQTYYLQKNRKWVIAFWRFHMNLSGLYLATINYTESKLNEDNRELLEERLRCPDPEKPLLLLDSFRAYLEVLKESRLTEIGYIEKSFPDKMRMRT